MFVRPPRALRQVIPDSIRRLILLVCARSRVRLPQPLNRNLLVKRLDRNSIMPPMKRNKHIDDKVPTRLATVFPVRSYLNPSRLATRQSRYTSGNEVTSSPLRVRSR